MIIQKNERNTMQNCIKYHKVGLNNKQEGKAMKKIIILFILYNFFIPHPVFAIDRIFTIIATGENGGNIIPKGEVSVISGRNKSFLIVPEIGFEIAYLIVDSKMSKPENLYTFSDVSENHTIKAVFRPKRQYTIVAIAGENGSITPSGKISVYEYNNQTFRIIPDRGFSIEKLNVDDMDIKPQDEFTFWDVSDNHVIKVGFAPIKKFAIMAEAATGGAIEPSGRVVADEHSDQVFRFQAQKGFIIKEVYIDMNPIGPKNEYVFRDIRENHSIYVEFFEARYVLGRVMDRETREGLSGSVIEAWSLLLKTIVSIAFSDSMGRYTLNNLPPIDDLVLRCQPPSDMPLKMKMDTTDVKTDDGENHPNPIDGQNQTNPIDGQNQIENSQTFIDNFPVGNTPYSVPDSEFTGILPINPDIIKDSGAIIDDGQIIDEKSVTEKQETLPIRQSKYPSQFYNNKLSMETADLLSTVDHNLTGINFSLKAFDDIGFRGRVHNGYTGVENVMVVAFSAKNVFNKFAITDENGDYTINYLMPSDDYIVAANFPDLKMQVYYAVSSNQSVGIDSPESSAILQNFATPISPSNPYLENINLVFDPGAEISGHVYTDMGFPVRNIKVNAWSPSKKRGNSAITSIDGSYTIRGLTQVLPINASADGYLVETQSNLYPYQVFNNQSDKNFARLVATGRTDIDFYLRSGFSISGQVRTSFGLALPGVVVFTHSEKTRAKKMTLTDDDGYYTFVGLTPSDDYRVAVYATHYPVQYFHQQNDINKAAFVCILDSDAVYIDFILDQGAKIQGEVRLEKQLFQQIDAVVHIHSFSTQSGGDVRVERDGTFMMAGLDESVSDYRIMVEARGYPPAFYADNGDDDPENDTVYEHFQAKGVAPSDKKHILILKPGYRISGKIITSNMDFHRIHLKAWSETTRMEKHAFAYQKDNDYVFEFQGFASGQYHVMVDEKMFTSEEQIITIQDNDIENVQFILSEVKGYEISGFIYNLPQEETVSIHAWSLSIGSGSTVRVKGFGRGVNYRIKGLAPASDYRVELLSERYPTIIYDNQTNINTANLVDLTAGDARDIDFTIDESSDVYIIGTITFPDTAQMGESVRVNAHSRKYHMSSSTTISLGNINPVPYTLMGLVQSDDIVLSIWPEKYPHQFYDQQIRGDLATPVDTSDDTDDIINFTLDSGKSVTGQAVNAEGITVVNARISIFSESTGSRAFAMSDASGLFEINGLRPSDDYYLMAYSQSMGSFYYASDSSSVRNKIDATALDLSSESIEIVMNLSEGYAISGTVENTSGTRLENVRVVAWSETLEAGNSTFSDSDGSFIIQGLASGLDYQVTAKPDKHMSYQSQTRSNIETGTSDIQFLLSSLETFSLSGTVMDSSLTPVSGATVEICLRSDLEDCAWDISDENGLYKINGLSESNDYQIDITPEIDSSEAFRRIYPFVIVSDSTKDITLSTGKTISGFVLALSDDSPVSNASVQIISESSGYYQKVVSGIDGSYEFTRAPDLTDFEITASSDGYIDQTLTDQAATEDIDFSMEAGGSITGQVTDAASGAYIEGAIVEIYSYANQNTSNYGGIAMTDDEGNYSVEQLKIYDEAGDTIADYVVTAHAVGYPQQLQSGNMAGDSVNLYLYADSSDVINLTITDSSGMLSDTSDTIIWIYDDSGFVGRQSVSKLTDFTISGLSSDSQYQFLLTAYDDSTEILSQWASADGTGVPAQDQAGTFAVGSILNFDFQSPLKRSARTISGKGPGPVRNLRSTTHDYRRIYRRLRTSSNSDTSTVSNNPNITVTWDEPEEGEDNLSGYYTDFNTDNDYAHTTFNTVQTPLIRTRKITSADLAGDDVYYYFHVASVDVEGRVGSTTSIAFRIDTVAPTNVNVIAPDTTTDRNIALILGATGASNVYVSNVNYAESGSWDNLSTEKEWKLTRGDGIKTIYVRFRDAAGNTSDTMAVTTYEEIIANSSPMISDRTFTITESLTDNLFIGQIEASDADNDPLTFMFDSETSSQGFELIYDSGLLFIDRADVFPTIPQTYALTVTVEDAEEIASATVRVNVSVGNYPPEISDQGFTIDEHFSQGSIIGPLNALDQDEDTLVYFIMEGNDESIFFLTSDTGYLSVASEELLDFETQSTHVLTVGVSDNQITSTAQITIHLNNINDHAPTIQAQTFQIQENPPLSALIGNLGVSDADATTPVCSILSGNDTLAFDIQNCQLFVNDPSAFDYETQPNQYMLEIQVSDGSFSNAANITVNVMNINDLAPEISAQTCTVIENATINFQVYTIIATDPDNLSQLIFQFENLPMHFPFQLDSQTGIIRLSDQVDYETQTNYTCTIAVSDNQYTASAQLTIQVLNENDNAPVMDNHYFTIFENISNGSHIGSITAMDADCDPLSYSLNHMNHTFQISDANLIVIDNQIIETYEQGGTLTLTVTVSDGLFTTQANIYVSITPVNDHAPVINDLECNVPENQQIGSILLKALATDADSDDLTYSFTDGLPQFSIDPQTSEITIESPLDFETTTDYTLTVQVWDGLFTDSARVVIHVININDNAPTAKNQECSIEENSPAETIVCQIDASDMDNDLLSFQILTHDDVFHVLDSGIILVKNSDLLNFEQTQSYTVQTAIMDGTYTIYQHSLIHILNINDNMPEIITQSIQTLEDQPLTTCMQLTDPDMDALTLSIDTQGNLGHAEIIDQFCIQYTPFTNAYGNDIIMLRAFDGMHDIVSDALRITIISCDDPPAFGSLPDISLKEDSLSDPVELPVIDNDTPMELIQIAVVSNNIDLIPNLSDHIRLTPIETGYLLQIKPTANESGSAQLIIYVSDETTQITGVLQCMVQSENDPPYIAPLADVIMDEDTISTPVSISISDNETAFESLSLTVVSDNSTLIPNNINNLSLTLTDGQWSLIIQPAPQESGQANITVIVNDATQTSSTRFLITVIEVNDCPQISGIPDQLIEEDHILGPLALDIIDMETATNELSVQLISGNTELVKASGMQVIWNNDTWEIQIEPIANVSGHAPLTVTVSDGAYTSSTNFGLTVKSVNDPPIIQSIQTHHIEENAASGPIPLDIYDPESTYNELIISITSSNTDLLPINNEHVSIVSQSLYLTPVMYASGDTMITITVSDGNLQCDTAFLLNVSAVNQAPKISQILDISFDEDTAMTPLSFTVADIETSIELLQVRVSASNSTLFPKDSIDLNYHDNAYWLSLSPPHNLNGESLITIYVDDGIDESIETFTVNVLPVEDPPVLTPPIDIQLPEDAATQSIPFVVSDPETAVSDLIITAYSDNLELIPQDAIQLTGTTADRLMNISIAPGHFGIVHITLTVTDASGYSDSHDQTITVVRGNTLSFNGENDYVEVSDHESIHLENTLTAEVWIQTCTITSQKRQIINKIDENGHGFSLALTGNNVVQLMAGSESEFITIQSTKSIPANIWTHIAVSIDPQTIILYINGQENTKITHDIKMDLNQSQPLIFGGLSYNPTINSFCGQMDDVRLWQVVRTQSQIESYMHRRLEGNETGLAGYWHFKDNEANDHCDATDNHGIIHKDAPMISMIPDQYTTEDTALENIEFSVSDLQTNASDLNVSVYSSDEILIPQSNLLLSGTDKKRHLTLIPSANKSGTCIITISVDDGETVTKRTFTLKVLPINDAPVLTILSQMEILEDTTGASLPFQISDIDSDDLQIDIQSSNTNLLPLTHISIQSNYLEISPISNMSGSSILTMTVSDGTLSDSKQLTIHVLPVNDLPVMSVLQSYTQMEDSHAIQLPFEIFDLETSATQLNLSVTCESDNCFPYTQVQITGQGSNRFLEATPLINQSGSKMISIILFDENNGAISQSLTLTVLPVNDPPKMSSVNDVSIDEDCISDEILVMVTDIESLSKDLKLTAISSNKTLLPDENIEIIGTDSERKIMLSPARNRFGASQIQLTVSDPDGIMITQTFTLTVNPLNDAPEIHCISSLEIDEDTVSEAVHLTILDIDTAFDDLNIWGKSSNTDLIDNNGIEIIKNSSILFLSPKTNQSGESIIQVVVSDSQGLTSCATLTLTVKPVNDAPKIQSIQNITISEDAEAIAIPLTISDIETSLDQMQIDLTLSDHNILSYSHVKIEFNINQYNLQVHPGLNVNGTSQICISVMDTESLTSSTCFILNILPVNDPPTLSEFTAIVVNEDTAISPISFTVADIETPSDQLIVEVNTFNNKFLDRENYVIQGVSEQRELIITPSPNTFGSTWFAITVTDESGASKSQSFLLDIQPVNDPPTIDAIDNIVVDEDQSIPPIVLHVEDIETWVQNLIPKITVQSQILSNDDIDIEYIEDSNTFQLTIHTIPNMSGESTIIVEISDAEGLTDITSFIIYQNPVNDPPTLLPIEDQLFDEDCSPFSVPLIVHDLETSTQKIQFDITSENQDIFKIEELRYIDESLYVLQMACVPDAFGKDRIQVIASDAEGLTAMQSFSIEIRPVNDPPTIQDINDQISQEDVILEISDIQINDVDDSENLLDIQIIAEDQTLMGEYFVFSLTHVSLIPRHDAYGNTQVTITVKDLQGLTVSTSFLWQVVPMKDMPTISNINDITLNEDTTDYPISLYYGHVDYPIEQLSVSLVSSNNNLINPEKQVIEQSTLYISPAPDQWGQVELCIQVSDPNTLTAVSCFDITIVAQNDAPRIQSADAYSINEDTEKTIYFSIEDIDSTIDISMITCQTDQTFDISTPQLIAESFALNLTPHSNYYGNATLTIGVNDSNGGTDQKTITIHVLPVNDIPVAYANQWQSFEDISIKKALHASDIDNDDLTYFIDTVTQSGRMTLLSDHSVQYTPDTNFYGMDRFSFHVFDGQAISESAWIDITVQNTPDMPNANAGSNLTINELQTVTLDASLSSDPDNDIAAFAWLQIDGISVDLNDSHASIVSFDLPDISNDQDLLFQLTVTDQTGRKNTDTVTVHVIDISAPTPGFSGTPVEGIVPLEVQFTDSSLGKVNDWEWEFGDGYISHEQHPLHVYTKSGEYSVILTVEGPYGRRTKEQTDYIYASPADIKAGFSSDLTCGVAPLTVKFIDLSEGEIDQIIWNFGDNSQSSLFSPEHTFDMPGSYTVIQTVYGDDDFDQIQKSKYIQVDYRTISGTIYSNETPAQLLSGVDVVAFGSNFSLKSQSNAQGNYTIIGLPASNNIKLGAFPKDNNYLYQFYNQKANLSHADYLSAESHDLSQIDFYLDPMPSVQMTGRVYDSEKGKELLLVSACSELIDWCVQTTTDSNGHYTLKGLKPASDYLLSVWWENQHILVYYTLPENQIIGQDIPESSQFEKSLARVISITDTTLYHMDMILSLEQTQISGRIINTDGLGIGNVWVNAWNDELNTGNGAFSDSLGNYTIIGLQAAAENGYIVSIAGFGGFQYPNRVIVPSDGINLQIPATTWIMGKIESESGEPLSNACVNAWSLSDDASQIYFSCTDQNGRYTLLNMPYDADYVVQATSADYLKQYYQSAVNSQTATTIDLTHGPQENINFRMIAGGTITGQIFLQTGQTAAEGIEVNLWSPSESTGDAVKTQTDGTFQINGLDQSITDYYIKIDHDNFLPAYYCDDNSNHACNQKSQATGIAANGGHYTMVLQTGYYLCGNVTGTYDESSNIRITAVGENDGIQQTVGIDTGLTPNFCIQPLTLDIYHIEIYEDHQLLGSQDVVLIASKNDLIIPVEKVNDGQISGQIQGLPENEWAQVRIWSESLDIEKIVRMPGSGNTVSYVITQLPRASDYIAMLSVSNMIDLYYDQSHSSINAGRIDISSDDQSNIDFTMESNTVSIWGTLFYQSETPFIGSSVFTAWSPSTGLQYQKRLQTISSNQVDYSITGMQQASDYIVKVDTDGFVTQYFENAQKSALAKRINLQNKTIQTDVHFYLQEGIQITGNIATNLLSDSLFVEIENQETGEVNSVTVSDNYAYTIIGLRKNSPYILWVKHESGTRWYYKKNDLAYNAQYADIITLSDEEKYLFQLSEQQSIAGSVQSESGKPVSGMWVQASDLSGGITMGAFTNESGHFEISNLPIKPYDLKICPYSNSTYKAASKSNIEPGNQTVRFILQEKTGAVLSGVIKNLQQLPEANARVEVIDSNTECIQAVTDIAGNYEIKGLNLDEIYSISVYPSKESLSAFWHDQVHMIEMDQKLNISISAGIHMHGRIISAGSDTGIYPATIVVESASTGYQAIVRTDENGGFTCFNMPLVSDYLIRIMAEDYQQIELLNQTAMQSRIFKMNSSGILSGYVKDRQTGSGIAKAVVYIRSVSLDIEESAQTDHTGYYRLTGLTQYNETGNLVADYELTVIASNYPIYAINNVLTGQERNIVLSCDNDSLLKGIINHDESIQWIVDIFKDQGDFVQSQLAQSNKWFSCSGLDRNSKYQFRIGTSENYQYWVGSQGELLSSRTQCGRFSVNSQIQIDATINSPTKRNRKEISVSLPNIRSTSHQTFTTELPFISNMSVIAMTWDMLSEESIMGYYVKFSTQMDFHWQKSNTAGIHPLQINSLRSRPFTGENVKVYCHIAAVDNMGNLGETSHAGPYVIDTVPPHNAYIKGPTKTNKRNVLLQLYAQDASETYISTSGYEMGGIWVPYAKTLTYLLPDNQGQHIVYARFRDSANNTTRTSTSIKLFSPENHMPIAISKTWDIKEDTTLSNTLIVSDEDNDSLKYIIQTQTHHGVVTLTNAYSGSFTYRPFEDFCGTDTFTFQVSDGVSQSLPSQCTVIVDNQNDAPEMVSQEFDVLANQSIAQQLIATDIDNDLLTFKIINTPFKGTLYLINPHTGAFKYIPEKDAIGTDSFVVSVSDQEITAQPKLVRLNIISQESRDYWYTGIYPEGYIVDNHGNPLSNIQIIYTNVSEETYTQVTDEKGYFIFETNTRPKSNYPLQTLSTEYASICMPWPRDNPPETYTMLSFAEAVLLTGLIHGLESKDSALIQSEVATVRSVNGTYTLAVHNLPVDLSVSAAGYNTVELKNVVKGMDITMEKMAGEQVSEDDNSGCFIDLLFGAL
jgi:PKD repeat protein